MSSKLKFSKRDFQLLDVSNLLINIWEYNERGRKNQCLVCIQYEKWCIEVAQEKWKAIYLDFEYVIKNLQKQNKAFTTSVKFHLKIEMLFIILYINGNKLKFFCILVLT